METAPRSRTLSRRRGPEDIVDRVVEGQIAACLQQYLGGFLVLTRQEKGLDYVLHASSRRLIEEKAAPRWEAERNGHASTDEWDDTDSGLHLLEEVTEVVVTPSFASNPPVATSAIVLVFFHAKDVCELCTAWHRLRLPKNETSSYGILGENAGCNDENGIVWLCTRRHGQWHSSRWLVIPMSAT